VLVSNRLEDLIQTTIDEVNRGELESPSRLNDTAVEFSFFASFRSLHIRDVAWGVFERCIGTNNCPNWPTFERIQMYPEEGVYHAVNWRFIPAKFHLASIVEVCGVRMGADKLTHFFDDGFHYFNATRSERKNFDLEDVEDLSMAMENSYMGTRLTGIVSHADIEANLAGVRFYNDIFSGSSPMVGRDQTGKLVLLRSPNACDYVTDQFDERVLPNDFVYGLLNTPRARERSRRLQSVIAERIRHAEELARDLSEQELAARTQSILARRIPMTRWQKEFPKFRLVGHATGVLSHVVFDSDFRRASRVFGVNPLKPRKLKHRKPVVMHRVVTSQPADAPVDRDQAG
jgi:hypothetical protein